MSSRHVFRTTHPQQQPLRWVPRVLGGAALVTVILLATAAGGHAAGLFDRLLSKGSQRSEAPPPQEGVQLATVRLSVEGMVCYG